MFQILDPVQWSKAFRLSLIALLDFSQIFPNFTVLFFLSLSGSHYSVCQVHLVEANH